MAGVVVSGAQVSYISQDCEEIPEFLGRKYGHVAKRLDLSFNLLSSTDGLQDLGTKIQADANTHPPSVKEDLACEQLQELEPYKSMGNDT